MSIKLEIKCQKLLMFMLMIQKSRVLFGEVCQIRKYDNAIMS